ncbi:hypothetical protein MSIBF_A2810005 [groundwater metagenome]|uniref:Uncharacterized protein n=1 Tax=groundwater metagenome TaxID=717931 RepID=A0A098EBE6_9ZZZZ
MRGSWGTVKDQLIKHGAEITVTDDNIWTVKLNKKYKFKAHAIQILNSIRQKVTMNRYIKIILQKGNI